jgi:hypothetical protein
VRAEGFVQELGQPQSGNAELPVEDREDLAEIAIIQHVIGGAAIPNDRSQCVRFLRPIDDRAAVDAGLCCFGAFEPAVLEAVHVGAPVPNDLFDEAKIPGGVKVGRDVAGLARSAEVSPRMNSSTLMSLPPFASPTVCSGWWISPTK